MEVGEGVSSVSWEGGELWEILVVDVNHVADERSVEMIEFAEC